MSSKLKQRTHFRLGNTIESIYTGGAAIISHDGKTLFSTVNGFVHVRDLVTLKLKVIIHGDGELITSIAIHPDGKKLVTASQSLRLRLYDLEKLESLPRESVPLVLSSLAEQPNADYEKISSQLLIRDWKAHDAIITTMAFHPSHPSLLATGSADTTVRVWDVARGFCTHHFRGHRGILTCLRFCSAMGKEEKGNAKKKQNANSSTDNTSWSLFSASEDGQIRRWDLVSKECSALLEGHVSAVTALDFLKDGTLLSAGRDKVVHVWKTAKNQQMSLDRTLPAFESLETLCVLETSVPHTSASSSSPLILLAGERGIVRIFDFHTWSTVYEEPELTKSTDSSSSSLVRGIVYAQHCPASSSILLVHRDHTLRLMTTTDYAILKHIMGHLDDVIDLKYLDSNTLVIATNSERAIILNMDTMDTQYLEGHTDIILSLDISADRQMIVTGSKDNTARIWKRNSAKDGTFFCSNVLQGHTEAVSAVAFSKRSLSFLITASQDRTVKLWKIAQSAVTAEFTVKAHDKDINAVDVSPNDKIFATASQDKTVKLFSTQDGRLLSALRGHKRGVWSVAFSPIDQCLVTASGDKTLKLWSAVNFSCLKSFEGHLNSILKVSFMNEGTQLVSAGSDGLVKLWTIKTNECVSTLDHHSDRIWALSVLESSGSISNGDGIRIFSGGADSRINVWHDATQAEEDAKHAAEESRILKEQELSNYLIRNDYKNAILLAMTLDQPYKLFQLFESVANQNDFSVTSITGSVLVDEILTNMTTEQTGKMLTYIREWNTRAKTSRVAQTVLNCILKLHAPQSLLALPSMKELLEALIPYTDRHFQRGCQLISDSYIVDFTLSNMDVMLNGALNADSAVGHPMSNGVEGMDTG